MPKPPIIKNKVLELANSGSSLQNIIAEIGGSPAYALRILRAAGFTVDIPRLMKLLPCPRCSKPIKHYPSQQRNFCTRECQKQFFVENPDKKGRCLNCKQELSLTSPYGRTAKVYCNDVCRLTHKENLNGNIKENINETRMLET